MSPWKVILATMVIFGCGVATGGLVLRTALRRPPPHDAGFRQPGSFGPSFQFQNLNLLRRMDKELALDTNQHDRVEKILRASQDRTQQLWTSISPGIQRELVRMRGEVRDALSPEQQTKFETMLQSRPRHPDGPPPRGGDQRHGWQEDGLRPSRNRTNGQQTNFWASPAIQNVGPTNL